MKRQTTKVRRRHSRSQVLEARVMSPRIAWFGFLRYLGKLVKVAVFLAILGGIGWVGWLGVQRTFYQNPDFRLQAIELNPNPVIDEPGLVEATGINLSASLFEIDVNEVTRKLKELPGLADAHAERNLPGTLRVQVTVRTPRAWVSSPATGFPQPRKSGGMLIDESGVAYTCPPRQLESVMNLPVIQFSASNESPILEGKKITRQELGPCFNLLDVAVKNDPAALQSIDSLRQANEWSLLLTTHDGTAATFSLGDHQRQVANLRAALDHANRKGYSIATINLIPKQNVPITVRESAPPKAIPISEPSPGEIREQRRAKDLSTILNRG